MNRTVLILVTHIVNEAVIAEYRKMKNTPYVDAFLAIDNHNCKYQYVNRIEKRNFYGVEVNCFFFDEVLHEKMKLPYFPYSSAEKDFGKVFTWNADNLFYYIKSELPEYEYYWRFEYDVFCNSSNHSYSRFLNRLKGNNADFIISGFKPVAHNSKWYWSRCLRWIYDDVQLYAGFFPVERITSRAVDFLYKKRLDYAERYELEKSEKNFWPYCEVFCSTELMRGGFSCSNLDEPYIRWKPSWCLNNNRFFEEPDDHLYHPVKFFADNMII